MSLYKHNQANTLCCYLTHCKVFTCTRIVDSRAADVKVEQETSVSEQKSYVLHSYFEHEVKKHYNGSANGNKHIKTLFYQLSQVPLLHLSMVSQSQVYLLYLSMVSQSQVYLCYMCRQWSVYHTQVRNKSQDFVNETASCIPHVSDACINCHHCAYLIGLKRQYTVIYLHTGYKVLLCICNCLVFFVCCQNHIYFLCSLYSGV